MIQENIMNKKPLLSLLTIILLACNAISSLFVTTPECAQLELTPQECANRGVHTYTYTGTIHTSIDKCSWTENNQSILTSEAELDIEFSKESVKICWKVDGGSCQEYSKTENNSYVGQYADENVTYPILLTFNSNGMSEEQQSPNCPTSLEYIRSE
jgi:hypothetical protein